MDEKVLGILAKEGKAMTNYEAEIHHPDHYTWKGTECKKVIEIMTQGLSGAEAYYMGNIIKYLYRYPKKGTLKSDLMKAEEYTKFLRELFTRWQNEKH